MISRQQEIENLWTSYGRAQRDASLRAFHSNEIAFWKRIDIYTSRLSEREGDLRFSAPAIQKDGEASSFAFARQRDGKKPVGIPSIDLILT